MQAEALPLFFSISNLSLSKTTKTIKPKISVTAWSIPQFLIVS
jgi:hypothetical protein